MWLQKEIRLKARSRGFHLIDQEIRAALPELDSIRTGLLHLWLQHTSASLTVNENADPLVREDFESAGRAVEHSHQRRALGNGYLAGDLSGRASRARE